METKTLEDDSVMESQEALELETKVQWGGLGEEEEEKAGVGGYRMFFLTVLPVAPNKYRPLNRVCFSFFPPSCSFASPFLPFLILLPNLL